MSRRVRIAHALAVAVCACLAVAHQTALLWRWYIEDSAISFAYARNLANGWGLVPWAGGERIEGYSNPTWVLLLGGLEWCGADAMLAAKWVTAGLAAATVVAVYFLARECVPARWREAPLLACALLAADPQFAIWGASGLENALFSFLLACALARSLAESRTGGLPWSAPLWFLLAITRPEAAVYCGVGLLLAVFAERRSWRRLLAWILLVTVPFALYHALRYQYFAWPFPMTYYGKLETKDPNVLRWVPNRGWAYIKDWALQTWRGLLVIAWVPAVVGVDRWRAIAVSAIFAAIGAVYLFPEQAAWSSAIALVVPVAVAWRLAERTPWPRTSQVAALLLVALALGAVAAIHYEGLSWPFRKPPWMAVAPPYILLGALAGVAFLGIGTEGWRGRVALWLSGCLSVGFAVQALGDWMRGFRWMSLLAVPGAVLAAVGVAAVGEGMIRWFRPFVRGMWGEATVRGLAVALGLVVVGFSGYGGGYYTWSFSKKPETSPQDVRARVDYMSRVASRLKIDERIRDLDVDQGAHVWWSRWQMYDIAGLIDVPLAINRFDKSFLAEYVFEEMRPHFAHLHGNWASASHIPTMPQWRADYIEIPGYPAAGKAIHVGNHVRRDLFLHPTPPFAPEWMVALEGGVTFAGFEVPSREVALGGAFRIHLGLQVGEGMPDTSNFRVVVFASDDAGHLASWDAAPGYDWVKPSDWHEEETFVGKYDFRLPPELPIGRYDLGIVIVGANGPLAPLIAAADATEPRFAAGELLFHDVLFVVTGAEAQAAAEADFVRIAPAAEAGRCTEAERAWLEARVHLPHDKDWASAHRREAVTTIARCYAAVAVAAPTPEEAVAALLSARSWDWLDPQVNAVGAALGARRHAAGAAAEASGDWEAAYRGYADAVAVDPTRSWSRRAAEEMRQKRLGIDLEKNRREKAEKAKNKRPAPRIPPRAPARPPAKAPAKAP
jgi:hypothetical protein